MTAPKVLVVGGTRFAGAALVGTLVERGAEVSVLSRRPPGRADVEHIHAERADGLKSLSGRSFDAAIDFICYGHDELRSLTDNVDAGRYAVISSAWMTRLANIAADESVPSNLDGNIDLPSVTANYLHGKSEVEREAADLFRAGRPVFVVRAPILWGLNDHTGRLAFYCRRLLDGGSLFLVDGGRNRAQVSWIGDIAAVLALVLTEDYPELKRHLIWETLSDEGHCVRDWVTMIAGAMNVNAKFADINAQFLSAHLPDYLDAEPLWREIASPPTMHNLFTLCGLAPTSIKDWLSVSVTRPRNDDPLRAQERELISGMRLQ